MSSGCGHNSCRMTSVSIARDGDYFKNVAGQERRTLRRPAFKSMYFMSGESFHSFQESGVPCSWEHKLRLIHSVAHSKGLFPGNLNFKYAATRWNGEACLCQCVCRLTSFTFARSTRILEVLVRRSTSEMFPSSSVEENTPSPAIK